MAKSSTGSRQGVNTSSLNKRILYRFLHENGPSSRQAILMGTGLSLPTITQGLNTLSKLGLVGVAESIRNTGGRNAISYTCLPDARFAIGLFFSVHHITAVVVDILGNIRCEKRIRRKADLHDESYLKALAGLADEVLRESGLPDEALIGVGISVQSLVSEDGEYFEHGMTQDFTGITRSTFAKYMPWPVRIFHDAGAAGFAEVWSRPDMNTAFYLSLNDVVGGAFIINGRTLFSGDHFRAGEIGHILIDPRHGELCYCGKRGCFDTFCRSTVLDSLCGGNLEEFFRLLDEGHEEAGKRFDTYLTHLAIAIHNIRMLLDSPVIVGGYVGSLMERHMNELCRRVDEYMIFGSPANSYVFPCRFRREAMAAGAAIEMLDDFIESL